ncbi:MAG: Lrp/AsnC family transcriptional regulator [Candidatus Eisenbacteria bacterium]|nr:Lrp/AsnC family transcriptional regulator [Candidatus Eisenbacteria bacterium]
MSEECAALQQEELAARVDLAESSCLERVRRLSATNVLRGFHAEVDRAAIRAGAQGDDRDPSATALARSGTPLPGNTCTV